MFAAQVPAILRQSVAGPDIPFRVRYSAVEANRLGVMYPFTNEEIVPLAQHDIEQSGNELVFSLITPDLQNPYTINYQFNIQRQLTSNLMWEIGYVGTRGVKFPMHRRFNLPDRQTGIRPNPTLIPGGYFVDMGESVINHSLQTSLRKRFSRNLSFDFHYTWGKTLAFTGGDVGVYYGTDAENSIQDFFDLSIERGPPDFDTAHRAVGDLIYELPKFPNSNGLVRGILGGWQVSGIYSGTTGRPEDRIDQGCSQSWVCRADYVGGNIHAPPGTTFGSPRVGSHQDVQFLNPAAFARVEEVRGIAQRPGNVGVGRIRGLGQWTVDFSLSKSFSLTESSRLQVRADMFNALNHVNLRSLNGNVENRDFGTLDAAGAMRQMQMAVRITF